LAKSIAFLTRNEQLNAAQNEKYLLKSNSELAEREQRHLKLQNKVSGLTQEINIELDSIKSKLCEALELIKQLQEINGNYSSEIKIHKRLQQKLSKELQISQETYQLTTAELEAERQKHHQALQLKQRADDTLAQQQAEMQVAQKSVTVMNIGIWL
jgi:hypothetical protein